MKATTRCCGGQFSPEWLERVAEVLRLLAHPQRLCIVELLDRAGEAPVHTITDALGLRQAVVSQHLNAMRRIGLVAARRRGKEVWYTIADQRSVKVLRCIAGGQAEKAEKEVA